MKKAEKEIDFHTDGCKLLIEAFSSVDDVVVFTITKYVPEGCSSNKKKLVVKRKSFSQTSNFCVCQFDNFEDFCQFCTSFNSLHKAKGVKLAKNIALYFWKDSYYLVLRNVNLKAPELGLFYSSLAEFRKTCFLFKAFRG